MKILQRYADEHIHISLYGEKNYEKTKQMLDLNAQLGVTDISALTYMPGCDVVGNLNTLWWKKNYPGIKIRAFGCFHEDDIYKDVPYEEQYKLLMALGCDGIKFIQMKPDRRKLIGKGINHPSYDKAFSMMEEDGTPVTIHSGDPQNFWDIGNIGIPGRYYGDGTFLSAEELYREDFEMLDRHPRLNVTFAHFFFLSEDIDRVRGLLEKYPNLKLDLTPGVEMFEGFSKDIDRWHDLFEEYSDRIMFGTDIGDENKTERNFSLTVCLREYLCHDRSEYIMPMYYGYRVKGMDLSDDAFEKICYSNYIRFVGEDTKPIDDELFAHTVERMYNDIKGIPDYSESAEWLKSMLGRVE